MESRHWQPLLVGDLAEQAWEAIRAIARALESMPLSTEASLAGGTAGLALFHGYLSKAVGAEAEVHAALAEDCLDEAIEALATTSMSAGLYSGFTGIAWAVEHLHRVLAVGETEVSSDDEDINQEIDDAILSLLSRSPWKESYDLISGLVGFGVYALERFPRPAAVSCLEAVLDRLDEIAERHEQGVTWFTPPELLPPQARESTPLGYYNLGVAHGVPGVIALLSELCRLGIQANRARPLLDSAVHWLLAQRRPEDGSPSSYASFVGPVFESRPARLAWCYGDPGIAAILLVAARATDSENWEDEALTIATRAAQTQPEVSRIRDSGLCHGALGLAHLYNRIYQAGGGGLFAESARLWYRLGLEMRNPERGVAGFASWIGESGQMWKDDPGFLTGAAGIGLALLAAVSEVEPAWDRVLLVSIPLCANRTQSLSSRQNRI
jgi:lantibiotic modifying enzyme